MFPFYNSFVFLFRRICSPFTIHLFSVQEDDIPDKTVMQVLPIQGTFIVVRSSQIKSDVLQQWPSANHCDHNLIIFSWRRLIKQQLSDAAREVGQTADEPKQSKKMPFTLSAFLSLSKCQTQWKISGKWIRNMSIFEEFHLKVYLLYHIWLTKAIIHNILLRLKFSGSQTCDSFTSVSGGRPVKIIVNLHQA